jgi:hypothetical protein
MLRVARTGQIMSSISRGRRVKHQLGPDKLLGLAVGVSPCENFLYVIKSGPRAGRTRCRPGAGPMVRRRSLPLRSRQRRLQPRRLREVLLAWPWPQHFGEGPTELRPSRHSRGQIATDDASDAGKNGQASSYFDLKK